MNQTCIDPGAIQEGDLMAYVDGAADEAVIRHVGRCPVCARRAEELASLQFALTTQLYRLACPVPDRLIAYQQGELGGGERLAVAQHLRQCPHCARELAVLARQERAGLGGWLRTVVESLEAALVRPSLSLEAAGVRGVLGGARPVPQVYRAGEVEVIVNWRPARSYPHRQDLTGLVHVGGQVPDTIGQARLELYRGEGLIAITPVSRRGQFTFAALEPGGYDLCLVWGSREIWLRGVAME